MKFKKILITTGIFPPKIGGPAQYAKNLKQSLEDKGCSVLVKTFTVENKMPTGIRHLFFFLKIIPSLITSDIVIALDTWSVAIPSVLAGKIFNKKIIIRTGGDFLWEQYVERTKKKVLLSEFYSREKDNFSRKDKIIYSLTKWTLKDASCVVFSTGWQRDIFIKGYDLKKEKTAIVENYYGLKEIDQEVEGKVFVASSRGIFLKNEEMLKEVFKHIPEVVLFTENLPFSQFQQKIANSYAVVAPAISEISPNLILDAIRYNRPFICTQEVGIYDRIKDAGIFIDPLDKESVAKAVRDLLSEEGYKKAKEKVRNFTFVHSWDDIAQEFISIFSHI